MTFLDGKEVDFDIKNENGTSLLIHAGKKDNINLAEFLALNKEKRIYEKDKEGKTIFDYLNIESDLYKELAIIKNTWPKVGTVAYVVLKANSYYVPGKVKVTKRVSKDNIKFILLENSFILSDFHRYSEKGSFYYGKTYSAPEKYFFSSKKKALKAGYKTFKLDQGRKIFY
ncbi:MAG: hypothetical protein GQ527_05630 [Bacteroidales bacterium]|nr:hypothetical protein [Bacteroidales bacterium]